VSTLLDDFESAKSSTNAIRRHVENRKLIGLQFPVMLYVTWSQL